MQVSHRADRFDLRIHQAPQSNAQRRKVGSEKFGIANQRESAFSLAFACAHIQRWIPRQLLLPLQNHFNVDR